MFYMDLSTDTRRKVKLMIIIAVVVDKIQKVGGKKKKKKNWGVGPGRPLEHRAKVVHAHLNRA